MQAAIDRVMQAITMMAKLTPAEARATRESFYLRGPGRGARRRRREAT
jgi:hypothetical protein